MDGVHATMDRRSGEQSNISISTQTEDHGGAFGEGEHPTLMDLAAAGEIDRERCMFDKWKTYADFRSQGFYVEPGAPFAFYW